MWYFPSVWKMCSGNLNELINGLCSFCWSSNTSKIRKQVSNWKDSFKFPTKLWCYVTWVLCAFADTSLYKTVEGLEIMAYSSESLHKRHLAEEDIDRLWQDPLQNGCVLPCLSVRSGLDLYFSVCILSKYFT